MNIFRRNHHDYPTNTNNNYGPGMNTTTGGINNHHHGGVNNNNMDGTYNNRGPGNIDNTRNVGGPGNVDNTRHIGGHGNIDGSRHTGVGDTNNAYNAHNTNNVRGAGNIDNTYNRHDANNVNGNYNTRNTDNMDNTYDRHGNKHMNNNYDEYDNKHAGGRHRNNRQRGFLRRDHRDRPNRHEKRERRALFDMESGDFNRRPSFGQWLKFTWLDILTMAAMGAVGLGVYNADPAPSRSFPIVFSDLEVVYPQFAYPLRTEIVPIWEAALLASLVPIAVILLMQIRIRSFWDVNNAIIGLLYSLITAAVFQVFVKWLIGGLRPHFLYVCAPDLSRVESEGGQGFRNIMFRRDICTGDRKQINDSLESMPSGHSTAAFAGFIYLYCYLNAKLKVFANYHPAMWKILAVYAPVLGACLIAGSLTIDEFHNWYDCLAGAIIGTIMAFSAYRMVYASVWDFRFNHIPLTRHTPFSYGAGPAGAGGFESAVWTRQAGWGMEEAYGGAPFDAATHLRGAAEGFNTGVHQNGNEKHGGMFGKHNERREGDVEHNAGVDGYGTGTGRGVHDRTHDGRHGRDGVNDGVDGRHGLHDGTTGVVDGRHGVRDGVNDGVDGRHGMRDGVNDGVDGRHGVHDGVRDNTLDGRTGGRDTVRDNHLDGRRNVNEPGYDGVNRTGTDATLDGTGDGNRYRIHSRSLERKAVRKSGDYEP